jgi:trimeric autotransporter adhesin
MGSGTRATFDVAGKTMLEVYESINAAGYANFNIANAATALGGAIFPAGSKVYYTSGSRSSGAITYSPAGKENPAGVSNTVGQYSPEVTAGGDTRLQAPGTGCTSAAANGNGTTATTLEGVIAAFSGNPCISSPGNTFTYQSVVYTNPDPTNEAWYAAALGLGNLGTAKVGSGPAPGFYTSNTKFRVAFKGSGVNPTTYYACKERFNNGSTRNCTAIGSGTYTITTLGDGRVMTFNELPAQMAPLTFNPAFVERSGTVYYGFQNKPAVKRDARFTSVATAALLSQLGLPAVDANVPLALTAGSYQGTWDVRDVAATATETALVINADGTATCKDTADLAAHSCTLTITNAATGAFNVSDNSGSLTGTFNFAAGSGSGTYVDPLGTPSSGNFVIFRR